MSKIKLRGDAGRAMGRRYLSSGKTRRIFAEDEGVTEPMVQYWASKVRRETLSSGKAIEKRPPAFVEVVGRGPIGIAVAGGAVLEMHSARMRFESLPSAEYVAQLAVEMARRSGC